MCGMRLHKPTYCPEDVSSLIMKCFNEMPEERPSFSEIGNVLQHGFDKLKVVDVEEIGTNKTGHLNYSIDYANMHYTKDLKTQYLEIKNQNKGLQKQKSIPLTSAEKSPKDPADRDTPKHLALKYINLSFDHQHDTIEEFKSKCYQQGREPRQLTSRSNTLSHLYANVGNIEPETEHRRFSS